MEGKDLMCNLQRNFRFVSVNLIGKPEFSNEYILPGIHNHNEEIIVEIHIIDTNRILVIIVGKNIRIEIIDEMKEIIKIGIMKIMDVEEIVRSIDETELIEDVDIMMIKFYRYLKDLSTRSNSLYINQLSTDPYLV